MSASSFVSILAKSLGRHPEDRLRVQAERLPRLEPADAALVKLLDGNRTLEEVVGNAAVEPRRIQRVLQRLKVLGALRLVEATPDATGIEPTERMIPSKATVAPPLVTPRTAYRLRPLTEEERDAIRRELDRVKTADPRQVLGVEASAGEKEIQLAYYALMRRFHPDVYYGRDLGDAGTLLSEIMARHSQAHSVLREEATRAGEMGRAGVATKARGQSAPRKAASRADRDLKEDAARQFEKGLAYYRRNDYLGARPYLDLACAFDPDNLVYREHRDRVRQMLGYEVEEHRGS